MGKSKKKQEKGAVPAPVVTPAPAAAGGVPDGQTRPDGPVPLSELQSPTEPLPQPLASSPAAPPPPPAAQRPSRLRRGAPDLLKVAAALAVIGIAAAIWYQPPLTRSDYPYVSYQFQGQTFADAQLLRPLAMPTRYYIRLPKKLAGRYEWFAVDRRCEVAALTVAPRHRFLGRDAIKRSDPLGLDLEFRKLDHSEWQVHFFPEAVVFSNAVLTVRMDTKKAPDSAR